MKTYKYEAKEILYYFAYIIYIMFGILRSSFFALYVTDEFIKIVFIASAIILCISSFIDKRITKKTLFGLVIIILFILIVALSSNSERRRDFIALLLFVYFGKNVKFEKIAKLTVVLDVLLLAFVILSSKLGIITEYSVLQGTRMRNFLGFLYTLNAPTLWRNAVFLYIHLKRKKIKYIELIGLFAISYYLYSETLSRLNFFLSSLMLIFALLLKLDMLKLLNTKIVKIFMCISFPASGLLSLYFANNYNLSYYLLNVALEGRISSAYNAINKYGIHIIGQPIKWVGNGVNADGNISTYQYNYVDNLYIQLLIQYGFILFVLLMVSYLLLQARLCKKGNLFLALILTILALHGLIDDLVLNLIYNTFWIVFSRNEMMSIDIGTSKTAKKIIQCSPLRLKI